MRKIRRHISENRLRRRLKRKDKIKTWRQSLLHVLCLKGIGAVCPENRVSNPGSGSAFFSTTFTPALGPIQWGIEDKSAGT
jgi:hypothetical protein